MIVVLVRLLMVDGCGDVIAMVVDDIVGYGYCGTVGFEVKNN